MNKTNNTYKIIFFGTPEFAVQSLQALHEANFDIAAVVTVADKPAGRGRKLRESAVKKYAQKHDLTLLQPTNLKSPDFTNELKRLKPNLQVVVAFRMLPEVVIDIPKDGTVNLHASLLPQYRGAAPINHAIMQGEKETGVTTFFINQKIDTGNILFQEKEKIDENDTAGSLHDKLMLTGAKLLKHTAERIMSADYETKKQRDLFPKDAELKKAPKLYKENCYINFSRKTQDVYNFIRGLSPYPNSRFILKNKETNDALLCQIIQSEPVYNSEGGPSKRIKTDNKKYLKIATEDGYLSIHKLKPQGKRTMDIASFLNGFNINDYIVV
ncbi:MAG: methionyl-tRNA formyltransferase [Bacteroidota bacterium]|nr:methionyl-tRNA formyltransferase [Bacteroidota bacterium]